MPSNIRILLPWYSFPPFSETRTGGLSVALWELSQNLGRMGVRIECLTPRVVNAPAEEEIQNVTVHRTDLGGKMAQGRKLEPQDRNFLESYDCVLSVENFGATSLADLKHDLRILRQIHTVARDRPLSTYLTLSPNLIEYSKMFFLRNRLVQCEKMLKGTPSICVSRFLVSKMEEHSLESRSNLIHIPNGVDTSIFRPLRRRLERDIVTISRFQKVKGLDVLIKSLDFLSRRGENYELGIVGNFSDKEQAYCLSLASEDTRNHIKFLGHCPHENIPKILNSSRLLVAPSRYESFCLPVLEAEACGLPFVASDVGGIPELVGEGVGLLIRPNAILSLAQAISTALRDDSLATQTRMQGPKKAGFYDWNALAPALVNAFSETV